MKSNLLLVSAVLSGISIPAHASNLVANGSFANPNVGVNNIVQLSSMPGWTSDGGDVFEVGDSRRYFYPCVTVGCQNLELNGNMLGSISQTVNGLTSGKDYQVKWIYGGRDRSNAQQMDVRIGGKLVGRNYSSDLQPWSYHSNIYTANSSSALLRFESIDLHTTSNSGNLVTGISVEESLLRNGSFEQKVIPAGSYTFVGGTGFAPWNPGFQVQSGPTNTGFCNGDCPTGFEGSQFAVLQGTQKAEQSFTMLSSGQLNINWLDAGRKGYDATDTYSILIDGLSVGSFSAVSDAVFTGRSILTGLYGAGSHTFAFQGTNSSSGNSPFIDAVTVTMWSGTAGGVPEPASWAMLITGFGLTGATLRRRRVVALTT